MHNGLIFPAKRGEKLKSFADDRLPNALIHSEVIICDKIGPMDPKSKEFVETLKNLLNADKKVIVVIHQKLKHTLTDEFRKI